MRTTALVTALLLSSAAQAEAPALASVDQTRQACSRVADLLAAGRADDAYASLLPYWAPSKSPPGAPARAWCGTPT